MPQSARKFRRLERADALSRPRHLSDQDVCAWLGEYTARQGYGYSETNQQITNLKKPPTAKPAELRYKAAAIEWWARELAFHLVNPQGGVIVPVPGSVARGEADHDDRLHRVLDLAVESSGYRIADCLVTPVTRQKASQGGARGLDHARETMAVDEGALPDDHDAIERVVVFDDVITTGASFIGAREILTPLFPRARFVGLFLARTVWLDDA